MRHLKIVLTSTTAIKPFVANIKACRKYAAFRQYLDTEQPFDENIMFRNNRLIIETEQSGRKYKGLGSYPRRSSVVNLHFNDLARMIYLSEVLHFQRSDLIGALLATGMNG